MSPRLEQLQRASFWTAIAAAVAGLATAGDRPSVGGPLLTVLLHALSLALGGAAGFATALRSRQIDRRRWEVVSDRALTKGEKEWAHKEAESQRTKAGATFLAAPVLVAGWLSRLLPAGGEGLATDLLPVTAMLGFGLGLALAAWRLPKEQPEPS